MSQCSVRSSLSTLVGRRRVTDWRSGQRAHGCDDVPRALGKGLVIVALANTRPVMVWNHARAKNFIFTAVELGTDDRWVW
jgi:hypothetical protein